MRIIFAFIFIFLITNLCYAQNKVTGLELPSNMEVFSSDKNITITGKCQGIIKWFVTSQQKTQYTILEDKNSINIDLPTTGIINIIAIGITPSGTTDFATLTIKVKEKEIIVEKQKSTLTLFTDLGKITKDQSLILNKIYNAKNINFILNDITSPLLSDIKYIQLYKKIGDKNFLVIESKQGVVVYAGLIPKTDKELSEILKPYSD